MAKKIKINEKKFNEDYETAEVIYKSFLKSLRKLGNRAMHSPFPVVKAAEMIIASCLLASEKVFKVHPSKKDYDELFKVIRNDLKSTFEILQINAEMSILAESKEGGEDAN